MALPYALYFITPASGQAALCQPCSCDLPPTYVTKALYSAQYRNLPGAGLSSPPAGLSNANLVTQTLPTTPAGTPTLQDWTAIGSVATTTFLTAADDQIGYPWRQDPTHMEDYLIFTDSLGFLCGAFPNPPEKRISFNNTGQPGSVPTAPVVAPH